MRTPTLALVALMALAGCASTPTPAPEVERGCGMVPDPSNEFMCFSELLVEFHEEAATLTLPEGKTLVEPTPFAEVYNAAGELETNSFERGYGRGDAAMGWLCLWRGEWLDLAARGENTDPALRELETIVDTYWYQNHADPASTQLQLAESFAAAALGDGSKLLRHWALGCGQYHAQYPDLPTTVE